MEIEFHNNIAAASSNNNNSNSTSSSNNPHHHHNSINNNSYCRSASLNMHHQYRGETLVATAMPSHHHHWGQPLCASNIKTVNGNNKKRDFHFQVIEVNQGPKWFIWPSQKSTDQPDSPTPSKNSSNQENENHYHKNGAITPNVTQPNAPMTINVAHLQRKSTRSRRKQLAEMHHHCSVVDSEYAHVTATNSSTDAPLSEPTTRRLLSKPIICVTPSTTVQEATPQCSSSVPSQTFKILSVCKKSIWESDDEDTLECSCRKMSLSLDDDCDLPPHAHCAAASGTSISSYISSASSSSSSSTSSSNRSSDDSGVGNNNY